MTKLMRVYVVAPEGRFIPGLGGRERGGFYALSPEEARLLAEADPGLSLEREPVKVVKESVVHAES